MTKSFIENLDGWVSKMMMQIMFELKMSDGVGWDGLRLLVDTIYAWALDEISTTATILKKKSPKIQY